MSANRAPTSAIALKQRAEAAQDRSRPPAAGWGGGGRSVSAMHGRDPAERGQGWCALRVERLRLVRGVGGGIRLVGGRMKQQAAALDLLCRCREVGAPHPGRGPQPLERRVATQRVQAGVGEQVDRSHLRLGRRLSRVL